MNRSSKKAQAHDDNYAKGNGIKHLPISILENIFVYLPPVLEQELMVEYMRKLNAAVMRVCGIMDTVIPSIANYQDSLFSEIVRGKYAF